MTYIEGLKESLKAAELEYKVAGKISVSFKEKLMLVGFLQKVVEGLEVKFVIVINAKRKMAKKLYRVKDMPWLIIEQEEFTSKDIKESTEFPEFDYKSYMERWKNIKSNHSINLTNNK